MPVHLPLAWLRQGAARWVVLAICILAGLAVRAALYHVQTDDNRYFISRWYDFIAQNGGFSALKYNLSNYNPPYLYLLAVATYLPFAELDAVKTISVIFDVVLALFTYRILRLKYTRATVPVAGALAVFLAPTVIVNSAAWGQCDAIYTAFCLGSLYFILTGRPLWACIFFGLAFSFKLQAVFFLPVLLLLLLRDKRSALCLLLVPITCGVLLLPAIATGRDVQSLLHIYVDQAETGGMSPLRLPDSLSTSAHPGELPNGIGAPRTQGYGQAPGLDTRHGLGPQRSAGVGFRSSSFAGRRTTAAGAGSNQLTASSFTFNAPSFYQWLPANAPSYWKWIGTALAGMVVLLLGLTALINRKKLTREVIVAIAMLIVVALPFLLPKMHERYFYTADVMSIAYAFWFPRYFIVPIVMQISSLLSYAPYFLNHDKPPAYLSCVAIAVLVLILVATAKLALMLYRDRLATAVPWLADHGWLT